MDEAVELHIANKKKMFSFDGTCPHQVKPYEGDVSSRMSIVFFQNARGWRADPQTRERLLELGFSPAASEEDAESFATRFERMSGGGNWHSWKLSG